MAFTWGVWPHLDESTSHFRDDGGHVGVEEGITTEAAAGARGQDLGKEVFSCTGSSTALTHSVLQRMALALV